MKRKLRASSLAVCLFAAGVLAAHAVATPPPGAGRPRPVTTIAPPAGTAHGSRVFLCHRTGSRRHPYVTVVVAARAVSAHLRHGDVLPLADGSCPGPAVPRTTLPTVPLVTTGTSGDGGTASPGDTTTATTAA
jgi:hypothetical protein